MVRATPGCTSGPPPCQVNGSPAGRKWTSLLARAQGGARVRNVFIEEPGRRTWSSMCVLCKESDGRLYQSMRGTLRFRPTSMQMMRRRDQWRAEGRAQRARSRFPLCDSGGRRGGSGATVTSGSGRLRRRPSAPSDGSSKGPTRGWTLRSGEWRGAGRRLGAGRWRGPAEVSHWPESKPLASRKPEFLPHSSLESEFFMNFYHAQCSLKTNGSISLKVTSW